MSRLQRLFPAGFLSALAHPCTSPTWGLTGLYLFALGGWGSTALANIGLAVALVALLLRLPCEGHRLRRDALLWLSLAFGLYLLPLTLWAIQAFPATRAEQIEEALDLMRLGFLPLVLIAFWLAERPSQIPTVLALALTGLLGRILARLDAIDIELFVAGVRAKFGMSPNALGLYCCVALLGLIMLAPRAWGARRHSEWHALRVLLWAVATVMMASGVIFAQSRAAWLALLLIFPPILLWQLLPALRAATPDQRRRACLTIGLGLALAAVLLIANHRIILKRVGASADSLELLARGEDPRGRPDAYNMRYFWWRYAFERFQQHPWVGWGPGTVEHLFQTSSNPQIQALAGRFKDFHNSLLQILIQVGTLGALFFALQAALVLDSLRRAWRCGWLARDVALFTLAALLIFFICSLSNLRTRDHYGQYFLMILGGAAYAWRLRPDASAASAARVPESARCAVHGNPAPLQEPSRIR